MANAILNFHFDFLTTSLITNLGAKYNLQPTATGPPPRSLSTPPASPTTALVGTTQTTTTTTPPRRPHRPPRTTLRTPPSEPPVTAPQFSRQGRADLVNKALSKLQFTTGWIMMTMITMIIVLRG